MVVADSIHSQQSDSVRTSYIQSTPAALALGSSNLPSFIESWVLVHCVIVFSVPVKSTFLRWNNYVWFTILWTKYNKSSKRTRNIYLMKWINTFNLLPPVYQGDSLLQHPHSQVLLIHIWTLLSQFPFPQIKHRAPWVQSLIIYMQIVYW